MVHIELQEEEIERAALWPWLWQRGTMFRVYVVVMLVSAFLLLRLYCRAQRRRRQKPPPID